MGATKFGQSTFLKTGQKITGDEAYKAVQLYRGMYPQVPRLWKNGQALLPLLASGMRGQVFFAPFLRFEREAITLPSGLKIRFPHLRRDGKEWVYDKWIKKSAPEPVKIYGGKVIENICQALAGEILKLAVGRCERDGIAIAGTVHDEVLAVAPRARGDEFANRIRAHMEEPPEWWPKIPLKSEVAYGSNWQEAKH